mgnify:CR=1 FL=1
MTAAAADRRNYRSTNTELPATYRRLVAEAVTYYKGALIADVGGAARKVTGTSGLKIIGWCEQESFLGSTTDPAYMDANHPQHGQKVAELSALYQQKHGTTARKLGGTATR